MGNSIKAPQPKQTPLSVVSSTTSPTGPGSFSPVYPDNQETYLIFEFISLYKEQQADITATSDNSLLPKELIEIIVRFAGFGTVVKMSLVCKYFRVSMGKPILLDKDCGYFSKTSASFFITKVVESHSSLVYFGHSLKLADSIQVVVPENLSIHMLTNWADTRRVNTHTVCAVIIQIHNPQENSSEIFKFLQFLFQKKHFKNPTNVMLINFLKNPPLYSSLVSLLNDWGLVLDLA